ncbi:extracellular solute-binding protein [Paenibacillus sp. 1P07SE]|uniref:extracellular solute-binding protein n=1 Tax=Paenibacillus sp. 1P07SE TaxID=3132209 RepID=UPI0039A5EA66
MKKKLWIAFSMLLIIAIVASACSNNTGSSGGSGNAPAGERNTDNSDTAEENSNLTEPGTFPIVNEKVTLRVLAIDTGRVENIETNEFTKYYEDLTNVHIEWELTPQAQANEKLNLMLASGDYPDVIMKFDVSPSQMMVYGDQGVFLSLNELIEEHGSFSKNLLEEKELLKSAITSPDGEIYALPMYAECYHCTHQMKMWINEPWLTKLGLEMPTTTEEFYQVLKAFKEQDPNGNGQADEIPLVGSNPNKGNLAIHNFLMNAFVYYDMINNKGLIVNNGKLEPSFTKPEFKEGLLYLNRLYADGLLAAETFTQDRNQLRSMVEHPGVPIVGAVPALAPSVVSQIGSESGRWLDLQAVPPLQGPNGLQVSPYNPYFTYSPSGFIITAAAKHPEVALRWGEGFYDQDIMMRSRFGAENEGWGRVEGQGKKSIDGGEAAWERYDAHGNVQNAHWGQTNHDYQSMTFRHSESAEVEGLPVNHEVIIYEATKNQYEPYRPALDQILPPLWFTQEQAGELVELETTIMNYIDEMVARFAIGDLDIEREWDNYVKTLENMNLAAFVAIHQEAYDAVK